MFYYCKDIMTELENSINRVVEALKSGEITMKELIKYIIPGKEKKVKTKEEKQQYLKEWREKNKDYFKMRRANIKIKKLLVKDKSEQPEHRDPLLSEPSLCTAIQDARRAIEEEGPSA